MKVPSQAIRISVMALTLRKTNTHASALFSDKCVMATKKQVPWEYAEDDLLRTWRWTTPHFIAQVRSDGSTFTFSVTDRTQGDNAIILNEFGLDFPQSQNRILEFVGKSYPVSTGYRDYAGNLATTFEVSDKHLVDFAPYEGARVVVTYLATGGNDVVTGSLQVVNHSVEVTTNTGSVAVLPPALIVSVESEFGSSARESSKEAKNGDERIVNGDFRTGCTGRPGYFKGTVEHSPNDAWCPLHRV